MPAIIYKNKNGERIPSVTTILGQWGANKQPLMRWAWKQGEAGIPLYEKTDADIGTLAHSLIEGAIKKINVDLGDYPMGIIEPATQCFNSFKEWKSQNNFNPIETEISLISEKYQYGGTIDCVATISNSLSFVDWKTGKEIYEDNIVQLASYQELWNENFPDNKIQGFHIIRTGKEIAMFGHYFYKEFPGAFKAFLHLRELYNLQKEIKKLK